MAFNPYQYYKNQALETSSQYELVGRCYGDASLSLKRAQAYIDGKNYEQANNSVLKAQKILAGLDGALDMQFEIAQQLHTLYAYMQKKLFKANLAKDKAALDVVAGMLGELRDTWEQAVKNYKKIQA
ncbi:MAG: flagellar export chaperone FliS [Ethanoligenens sp.]|uniref:flagellar export chaperone FliS n=1 Tax=Ethanoligenens sp. TaxID=2099655 RepID=UPI0039E7AE35